MNTTKDDRVVLDVIAALERGNLDIKRAQADPESRLDKRALSIAITHLETAQLWLANSRPVF